MLLYAVRKKYHEGFTLVEMLAALVIVGIIASIAAPNFLGMLNQTRVKDALGQVEGAIKEAQKLAVRRGRPCRIDFTTTGTGSDERSVVSVATGFDGCLLNTRELPESVSFSLVNSGSLVLINSVAPVQLDFSGRGNPSIEGIMVISHANSNTQKCIQIEGLLGNILTGDYVDSDGDGDLDCDPDITD